MPGPSGPSFLPALLLALAAAGASFASELRLFVAPNGDDAWSGKLREPNAAKTDGPFATLERARAAIRALKRAGGLPAGGVTVWVRGGVYELKKPFELGAQDSGAAAAPIVYRAAPGETVRLVAGKLVTNFTRVTDPRVLKRLDPAARPHVAQANLRALGVTRFGGPDRGGLEVFFNGKPMTLARWPNQGFTHIVKMVGKAERRGRHMTHKVGKWVYEGERPKRWIGEKDPWVHGYWFHDWADQKHRIKEIDPVRHTIEVRPPYHAYGYRKGHWYYTFNLLCEIDQPGEWYLDRDTGALYFWPPGDAAKGETLVSVLPAIVTMEKASYVTLRGMQLEAARGTAITIKGGEHNAVVGCTIRNVGGWAVRVSGGREHRVAGCDIYNTGEGGVALAGGDRKTLAPAGHVAENNHIHHYARIKRVYRPGITLSGVGCRAAHNLIDNAPHMAIGFGGNDHIIEFNEIHSVCYESNDAGAIYTGRNWTMRGNVIRYNYFHHICGFRGRGCVGVYLDDCFSSATIFGNVFYKVTRAAMIGGGRDNAIVNNIFVDCVPAVHVDARGVGWAHRYAAPGGGWRMQEKLAEVPYQKPPWTKYPHLANILNDEPYLPKYNVIAHNIFVRGRWNGIRKKAQPYVTLKDNLIDEDPHFVDAAHENFQLRDDSPAFKKIGFQRIPFEKIGLYKSPERASWPVTSRVRPMPKPPRRKPARRRPAPVFKVPRAAAAIRIDGVIAPAEWGGAKRGAAMVLQEGVRGEKVQPRSYAWLRYDDKYLYVAVLNEVDPKARLKTGAEWGHNDAVEIALRNPAAGRKAPIIVLRGYVNGQFESSDEAGAPFEATRDAKDATTYAARVVDAGRWAAEWRIAFAGLGIDPKKRGKIPFNLSARKMASNLWLMWRGTGGYTWQVDKAGFLALAR